MSSSGYPDTLTSGMNDTRDNSYNNNGTGIYPEWSPPSPPPSPTMGTGEARIFILKKHVLPLTICIGILGNAMAFYIFTRTKLKKPSSSRYLAAAAVADTGFLCTTMVTLAQFHDIQIFNSVGLCQLTVFGNHLFTFLATWYLTAVIVEKYVGVYWPRKKSRMCTVFRAKCVIICLAILGLVCYLYLTYFFGVYEIFNGIKVCAIWSDHSIREAWQILSRMDAIVNFAIPYIIMFILSCLTTYKTWQYHKQSRSAGDRFLRRQRVTTPQDKEFKTTPLLMLLVLCSLLLCTPNNTSSVRRVFQKAEFIPSSLERQIYDVFHYMFVLNNCIKVFVYMVASRAFLTEVGNIFCCFRSLLQFRKSGSNNELQGLSIEVSDNNTKTVATSTEGML